MKKQILLLVFALFVAILLSGSVSAANITVSPGSNAIHNAISSASSGDTINLKPGTYYEHDITVNKKLTIVGPQISAGSQPTAIIDAQKQGRVFSISNGVKVTLQNLLIRNGSTTGNGSGIYNNGNLTVKTCTITNNTAAYGGGIYNNQGNVTLIDSIITYNNATSTLGTMGGSAIYNHNGTLNIIRTAINFNSGWYGQIAYDSGTTSVSPDGSWKNPTWQFETVDSPGNVGMVTSLVMDSKNNPHIMYYDYYGSYWKYAYKSNGIWYKETIDYAPSDKYTAYKTSANSLVLDSQGNPHVLYQSPNGLKYAYKEKGIWHTEIVDSNGGKYTSIALDSEGNPHISYENSDGYITYRVRSPDMGWSNPVQVGGGLPNTCPTSIQVDKQDNAHIAYFGMTSSDGQHTGLCYASQGLSPGEWRNEFVVLHNVLMPSTENRNIYLTLDSQGQPHITCGYLQSDGWRFAYIYKEDSVWNPVWHIDLLNDVAHSDAGLIGLYNSLVMDSKGNPHICYNFEKYDAGAYGETSLRYLDKNANGQWNEPVIVETFPTLAASNWPEGMRNIGKWCSMALDSYGNPCISYFDDLNKNLIYAYYIPRPMVVSSDPANYAVNVPASKTITVTFNKSVKAGNMNIQLKNNAGTLISTVKSISGSVLIIDPVSNLAESLYTLVIGSGAVTDLAGDPVAQTTLLFSVGTSPTVTSTSPVNGATGVALNKVITLTFNENIKPGSYYMELKDSNGNLVNFSKSINGKVLTITPTTLLAPNRQYTLTLYAGSIMDLAGNPIATKTITFTTGAT